MEAAVAVTEAAWCVVNQVTNGPPHVGPRQGEGVEDEFEFVAEGLVEFEHESCLVELLCGF